MRRRATLLGSIGLCFCLGILPAAARDPAGGPMAVPPLTSAEVEAAFAPVDLGVRPSPDRRELPPSTSPSASISVPAVRSHGSADETAALGRRSLLSPIIVAPGLTGPDLAAASAVPAAGKPGSSNPADLAAADPATPDPATPEPAASEPAPPITAGIGSAESQATPAEPADAPEAGPAPAAAMPVPAAALALSDSVRAIITQRLGAVDRANATQAAVAGFYAIRGNQPIWTQDGLLSPLGRSVLDRMVRAGEDGLEPRAYAVDTSGLTGAGAIADQVADTELAIASTLLLYAHDASSGRVNVRSIGRDILVSNNMPDPVVALASVAIAADPVAVLDAFNPSHPEFLALKAKLAELRANAAALAAAQPPRVPPGPVLRVGMADARVAVLRTRLGLTMTDGDIYDDALAEAVRSFQRQRRIRPTGTLGPQTIAALNVGLSRRRFSLEHEIISNMERWRWLPRDLGTSNVFVNVPEYRLRVTRDGVPTHEAKVIVGKPNTPTPIFSDTMEFVVLNPSWHVPQSIIRKEYLPKLMEDPDYLARRGFIVTYRGDQISVRQPPGEENALGHIKFMFPNNFSVYLHDTSSRNLFANEKRAFSHGCVRVDEPYTFAEIVMGAQNGWTAERVRKMVGKREQRVDLKQKIPVHISYFTARVDENGELRTFDDIYGYDSRVLSALGLSS